MNGVHAIKEITHDMQTFWILKVRFCKRCCKISFFPGVELFSSLINLAFFLKSLVDIIMFLTCHFVFADGTPLPPIFLPLVYLRQTVSPASGRHLYSYC